MFDFLTKLSFNKGVQISVMLFGNLIAPYWFLYQFFRGMVTDNNFTQQVIFCLAIGIPVTLIGLVLESWVEYRKANAISNKEDLPEDKLIFNLLNNGSIATAVMFYIPCMLSYFSSLTPRDAIMGCISAYVGILASYISKGMRYKKPKNKT